MRRCSLRMTLHACASALLLAAVGCAASAKLSDLELGAAQDDFVPNNAIAVGQFVTIAAPSMRRFSDGTLFFYGDTGANQVHVVIRSPFTPSDIGREMSGNIRQLPASVDVDNVEVRSLGDGDVVEFILSCASSALDNSVYPRYSFGYDLRTYTPK